MLHSKIGHKIQRGESHGRNFCRSIAEHWCSMAILFMDWVVRQTLGCATCVVRPIAMSIDNWFFFYQNSITLAGEYPKLSGAFGQYSQISSPVLGEILESSFAPFHIFIGAFANDYWWYLTVCTLYIQQRLARLPKHLTLKWRAILKANTRIAVPKPILD